MEAEEAASAPGSQRPTPWRGSLALGRISGAGTTCLLLTSAVKTAAHAGADVGGGGTQASAYAGLSSGQQSTWAPTPSRLAPWASSVCLNPSWGRGALLAPLQAGSHLPRPKLDQCWAGPSESEAFHSLSHPAWTKMPRGLQDTDTPMSQSGRLCGNGGTVVGGQEDWPQAPHPTCLMWSSLWGPLPPLRPSGFSPP